MNFDHLGIYLSDLSAAAAISAVFGGAFVTNWENAQAGLTVEEYVFAGTKIEFLHQEGRTEQGMDHVAFSTDAFDVTLTRLIDAGAVQERLITAASGKRIIFLNWNSMRIELMEN